MSRRIASSAFLLFAIFIPTAFAQVTITRTSSPVFYIDHGVTPDLLGNYVSYQIKNTGASTLNDIWVKLTPTGGIVMLAPNEPGLVHLGSLAAGATKTAFFYLQATTDTTTAQTHTVAVYTTRPPATAIASTSFSVTVEQTIAAAANKVVTVVSTPTDPVLGTLIVVTVTGETGTIGAAKVLSFNPATFLDWPADIFQLYSTSITLSGANTGTFNDTLLIPQAGLNTANTGYTATYTFRAINVRTLTTPVSPVGYISSGTQIKHTDTGDFLKLPPMPAVANTLTIGKLVSATQVLPGSAVTFTVRAMNASLTNSATMDDFVDTLPAGMTYIPGSSSYNGAAIPDPITSGQTLTWYGTYAIPANASRDLTFQATAPATVGPYVNSAVGHSGGAQIDTTLATTDNAPATATFTVTLLTDLTITKAVNNPTPNVGGSVTFTLTAKNNGPSAAAGVTVTDLLPSGYDFTSASPSAGTYNSSAGSWSIGNLASGATATLTIDATVLASGTYLNTATVTSSTTDPDTTNNTGTATTSPVPVADLRMQKTVNNMAPGVGTNITFTLTVINDGPSSAAGVAVSDLLPSGYSYVSSSTATGSYSSITGTWAIGTLAAGANATLTITAKVLAAGTYLNTATASATTTDPNSLNNSASVTPAPVAAADLAVAKTVNNAAPNVGSNVTFTVTVANNGLSTSDGIAVSDLLPAGYEYVSSSTATGSYVPATGIWTVGSLTNGSNATLTITATVLATGSYTNTATATATTSDPSSANNSASITTSPVPAADLVITKGVSHLSPNVGSLVTFTITVTNNGPSTSTGITVAELLPSGYSYASSATATGTYNPATGIWDIGSLSNGASAVLSVIGTVLASGEYGNTAAVSATTSDPNLNNNAASAVTSPLPVADLGITKSVSSMTPPIGGTVTFTLTLTNSGPSTATGIGVAESLQTGYSLVSATASAGTYSSGTWAIPSLANGATATLTITAAVLASGDYSNTVVVGASTLDSNSGNNSAAVTPSPVPVADLTISKSSTPNPYVAGSALTYTIVVANQGPSTVSNAQVVDTLPAAFTGGSWTCSPFGAGASCGNSTGVGNINEQVTLPPGGSARYVVTGTVAPGTTGTLLNTATVTAPSGATDPVPGNNTATNANAASLVADLQIAKSSSPVPYIAGATFTYTIVVTNTGPATATGARVQDALPAALSGFAWTCTPTGSGASCTSLAGSGDIDATVTLPSGTSATFVVTGTLPTGLTGPLVNTATVTPPPGTVDPMPGDNTARDANPTGVVANLSVTKSSSPNPYTAGSPVTYTIVVSNAGPDTATFARVRDVLPAILTGVTWTCTPSGAGASCGIPSGAGDVDVLVTLPSGTSATFAVTGNVPSGTTGSLVNSVTVRPPSGTDDPVPGNNIATDVSAGPKANLSITKTGSPNPYVPGLPFTYTVIASNIGSTDVVNANVKDELPDPIAGFGWTCVPSGSGASCDITSGTGDIDALVTLPAGTSATFTIAGTVPPGATATLINTAIVAPPAEIADSDPSDNSAQITTPAAPLADVRVAKTATSMTPNVGANVTFTVTVTNNGPSAAAGVTVTDLLNTGYSYVSSIPTAGIYTAATGVWDVGVLGSGASATLSITARVLASGDYGNSATASSTTPDSNSSNNMAAVVPTPVPVADLSIEKTVNSATPNVGSTVTFTVTVTNHGPSAAAGVSVSDSLPNGYSMVSAVASAGAYASGVWTVGPLANGAHATLTITATVLASGNYLNTATVTAATTDATPGNNTASAGATPVPVADLTITKTVNNASPNVGGNVTFTVTVTNNGPSTASGVSVTDALQSGYSLVSNVSSQGTYNPATGVWDVTTLANGATATLTITATVLATGSYANTATATATTLDTTPDNNAATVTTSPVPQANLTITKTVNSPTPSVGANVIFTVAVVNNGPSAASSVDVIDLLPSGYDVVSATATTGNYVVASGLWTIGQLANGASATLTITATVLATGNYANTATVSSATADPNTGNNTAGVSTAPVLTADVSVTKTVNNSTPNVGSTVAFTVTVANAGPSPADGVSVTDLLPSGYSFTSAIPTAGSYVQSTGVWTIGSLASGRSVTLTISATVLATGDYRNTATVTMPSTITDPNSLNNISTSVPSPVPVADVVLEKTVNQGTWYVGSTVTFTIAVTNNGPSGATDLSVVDPLPSGYSFVSSAPSTGGYDSGTGVWAIGSLAKGATATLSITATILPTGNYVNSATAMAATLDSNTLDNTHTASTAPLSAADLAVTNTPSNTTPSPGDKVTFTVTVTNNGPSPATGVTVTDLLPTGYSFVSASTTTGSYASDSGMWTIGDVPKGSAVTLTITAVVQPGGSYISTATVTATTPDPNLANNSASTTVSPNQTMFQVSYVANLNIGDSFVNLTNYGSLNGRDPAGTICVNVYVFDPNEEPVSCCSCAVTPNGLRTLSVQNDLLANPLTPAKPTSLVVKLLATASFSGTCDASRPTRADLVQGMGAWRSTLHSNTSTSPASWQASEVPFTGSELSDSELLKLTKTCQFIQSYASGFGICRSCRSGAQSGTKLP